MLELALKGRDIPAQGNALGQGSLHRQSPVRARHNPWPKNLKNEKELQDQKFAHRFFENLSQKTRFWAIVVRKFLKGGSMGMERP
jgi:hypothetical protein